jgi:hypothetical protein
MALLNAEPDKNGGSAEQSASQISEYKAQNGENLPNFCGVQFGNQYRA